MSSSPEPISLEPSGPDPSGPDHAADETPRTQLLDEQTPPTSALAVEPGDVGGPATAAYLPAATAEEPVPPSPDPLPARSPAPGRAARGIRMRTVVLGLVLLAVSVTSLLRVLTDVHVDDSLVVLVLLVVAGALLLGGGVASAAREARAGRARH
jgi:hypothetical protein